MELKTDSDIMVFLLMNGATVEKVSMYDEEGVEGWTWEYKGEEFSDVGDWNELPTLPEELKMLVLSTMNK